MSCISQTDLEQAATSIIQLFSTISDFSSAKIVVIGDMGLMKCVPGYRATEDIEFLIAAGTGTASQIMKFRLRILHDNPVNSLLQTDIEDHEQIFQFTTSSGKTTRIDVIEPGDDWQPPYVPKSALSINSLQEKATVVAREQCQYLLPYISAIDLLVFKINSCGVRKTEAEKVRDALDAQILIETMGDASAVPLSLSDQQRLIVHAGLEAVITASQRDETWWKSRLGLN